MLSMFSAGGFVMMPLMLLGLLALGAGACHALAPAKAWRQTAASLRTALLLASAAGVCLDLATVAQHLPEASSLEVMAQHASVGVSESLSPAIFGTVLAMVAALLCAVGDARQP
jgi:hypothetical protein